MADRDSTANPGSGVGGTLVDMARTIAGLQRDVAQLQRSIEGPAAGFLWIAEGGTLRVKRIETGGTAVVAAL